jgi:hypothetical protein
MLLFGKTQSLILIDTGKSKKPVDIQSRFTNAIHRGLAREGFTVTSRRTIGKSRGSESTLSCGGYLRVTWDYSGGGGHQMIGGLRVHAPRWSYHVTMRTPKSMEASALRVLRSIESESCRALGGAVSGRIS